MRWVIFINYNEAFKISKEQILPIISQYYALEGYIVQPIPAHEGGRNIVFNCVKACEDSKILRISFIEDRSKGDLLSEVEYIRYLAEHGAHVADVKNSLHGNLLEEYTDGNHTFFMALFEKAKGKLLVDNNYCYREGVLLTEYFYNCGKVLGQMHELSKGYEPQHKRYTFFDRFNRQSISTLIPDKMAGAKEKMFELLDRLEALGQNSEVFGMIHFDYSDGNYFIDFNTGDITVFDFDNACLGWYLYDLANLWVHGTGWIQFEKDVHKRQTFMENYFEKVLEGYRSETTISAETLKQLPLLIQAVLMESIIDEMEVRKREGEPADCDEEMAYRVKCLEEDIPYKGFFHEIYNCDAPFELAD